MNATRASASSSASASTKTVHISDIPTGDQGRVYLVEQNLITMSELQAIVDDYTAKAAELGHPPMQAWL